METSSLIAIALQVADTVDIIQLLEVFLNFFEIIYILLYVFLSSKNNSPYVTPSIMLRSCRNNSPTIMTGNFSLKNIYDIIFINPSITSCVYPLIGLVPGLIAMRAIMTFLPIPCKCICRGPLLTRKMLRRQKKCTISLILLCKIFVR